MEIFNNHLVNIRQEKEEELNQNIDADEGMLIYNLEDKNKHEISCLADKPDQNPCVLCFFPKDGLFVLLPCGHDSLCESCTIKISSQLFAICPSCRTPITGYKKNYIQVPK